jgi:hypothetical protein
MRQVYIHLFLSLVWIVDIWSCTLNIYFFSVLNFSATCTIFKVIFVFSTTVGCRISFLSYPTVDTRFWVE